MKQQKHLPTLKLQETSKKVSFNQFIFPVILIVVFYGLSLIFVSGNSRNNEFFYQPDSVEVVVEDAGGAAQLPEPNNDQELDMSKKLGPATVDEIVGVESNREFYQEPSMDRLLEGKEIEIR